MSVEAYLTRALEIRFIDARDLANEAKMTLGIVGYPTKNQQRHLLRAAVEIFNSRSESDRQAMRQTSSEFETIKSAQLGRAVSVTEESSSSEDLESIFDSFTSSPRGRKTRASEKGRSWLKHAFCNN